jgi:uncharacterized protein (TIGR02266 family)
MAAPKDKPPIKAQVPVKPQAAPVKPQAQAAPVRPQAQAAPVRPQAPAKPAGSKSMAPRSKSMAPRSKSIPPNGQEGRIAPRVDLEVDVTFESEHNFYTGFTQNISSGGLFISTHQLKPVGSTIVLKFSIPGIEQALEVQAVVRWIRDYGDVDKVGMGVQFVNLQPAVQNAINQFLQQRDSIFYDVD